MSILIKCITLKNSPKTDKNADNPAQLDTAFRFVCIMLARSVRQVSDLTTFGFRVRYFDIKGLSLKN